MEIGPNTVSRSRRAGKARRAPLAAAGGIVMARVFAFPAGGGGSCRRVDGKGTPRGRAWTYPWLMDNRADVRDFLMSRRARISPEAAGVTAGANRRVAGLRRSEVAGL